ncbi:MAG: ABC transporter permease [Cyanobacteria bacterium P01_A01_bin.105]
MPNYLLRRVLVAIPTLLVISLVIFILLSLAPGDPYGDLANNPSFTPEARENLRRLLGLDAPIHIRYGKWLGALLSGNLGLSFTSGSPVGELLLERLPTTLWVLGAGYLVAVILALPLGVFAALHRESWGDRIITTVAFMGFSLPSFFTGLLFILVFSVWLRWFPFIYSSTLVVRDWQSFLALVRQSVMPVGVMALFQVAMLMRFVRAAVLEQLPQDYVRTGQAKGLSRRRVVGIHILRNAAIPVITLVALDIPNLFTGSLVVEQVFRIPGIGALLIDAINRSDTPVIMAISWVYAVLIVVFNLVADVMYGWVDPRVRLGE